MRPEQPKKIRTPMDVLLDNVDWKCANCRAQAGTCDCWHPCNIPGCYWMVEKGKQCNNPNHKK